MACRKILKESALSAMRPPAEKSGKKLLLEHAKGIWDSLKMDTRLVLRNIFGNKRRTFLSAVGIASSMALVITGIGLKDAVVDLSLIHICYGDSADSCCQLDGDASHASGASVDQHHVAFLHLVAFPVVEHPVDGYTCCCKGGSFLHVEGRGCLLYTSRI